MFSLYSHMSIKWSMFSSKAEHKQQLVGICMPHEASLDRVGSLFSCATHITKAYPSFAPLNQINDYQPVTFFRGRSQVLFETKVG